MKCPLCNSKSKTIDSRIAGSRTVVAKDYQYEGQKTRRRYLCTSCKHRWSTIEVMAEILESTFPPETRFRKPRKKQTRKKKPDSNEWLERIKRKLEE